MSKKKGVDDVGGEWSFWRGRGSMNIWGGRVGLGFGVIEK